MCGRSAANAEVRQHDRVTTELERLANDYELAEAAFLAVVREHASRVALAERAHAVAEVSDSYNKEAYRKLHAGEEEAWMALDNLTDLTEALCELWSDLAQAYSA